MENLENKSKEQLLEEINKLNESENKYRLIFENMINGVAYHKIVTDKDGKAIDYIFLEINSAFEELTGLNAKDLIGRKVTESIPGIEKDPANWIGIYGDVALNETNIHFENYSKLLQKWYSINAYCPQKGYFITIFEDITKRKQAKIELKENQQLLNKVGEIAKIGGWEMDLTQDGKATWTKGTYDIIEINQDEAIPGLNEHLNYYFPEYREMIKDKMNKLIENQMPMQFIAKAKTKKGKIIWVEAIGEAVAEKGKTIKLHGTLQDITDKKKAEKELKESEEKYRLIFEYSGNGVGYYDLEGRIISFNQVAAKRMGGKAEDFIGKSMVDLFGEKYGKEYQERINKTISSAATQTYEDKVELPSGASWYISNYTKVKNTEGEVIGVQIISDDITQRKQAEIALKESEEQIRNIFDNSTNMFYSHDTNHQLNYVSPQVMSILGYTREEALIKWTDFATDNPINDIGYQNTLKAIQTGKRQATYELELLRKDGKKIIVEVRESPVLKDGKTVGIVGSLNDITERKKIESSLNEASIFNKTLLDTSPDIIYIYDIVESKNVYSNQGITKVLGYTVDEVKEMGNELIPSLMHEDDFKIYTSETSPKYQTAKDGELIEHEYRMKHKNGNWLWLQSKESIFQRLHNGSPKQIFGIISDITNRKLADIEIQNKNAYIETIMSNMPIGFGINTIDDGDVKYLNDKFQEIYGWSKEVLSNVSVFFEKVFPDPVYREKMKKQIISDMESGDPKRMVWDNLKIVTSSGEERYVKAYNIPIIEQNIMISTVQDVTEQRKSEIELIENQKEIIKEKNKAQQYLNIAEVILLSIDSDGIVQLVNPKGCEVLGYPEDEIIGKNWFDNFIPTRLRETVKVVAKKVAAGKIESVKYYENEILTKSGEERIIAWNNALLKDENGNIIGTLSSGEDITERIKSENQLRESQQLLINAIDHAAIGMCMVKIDGFFANVNQALCEMLGYAEEELLKFKFQDITHPDDYAIGSDAIKAMLNNEKGRVVFEKRYIHKDGQIIHVVVSSTVIRDKNGKPTYFFTQVRDITESKKTEEKIKQLSQIFEDSLNEIFLFDAETLKFTQVNKAAQKNLGYSLDELFELTPIDIKTQITTETFNDLIAPLLKGEKERIIFETVHQRKDKSLYNVEVHLQLLKHEQKQLFAAIIIDITERKKAEFELMNSLEREQTLADIVRNAPIAIAFGYPDGSLNNCNKAFSDLTGYTQTELQNISWNDVLTPKKWNDIEAEELQKLNIENNIVKYEKEYIHKSGRIMPVELTVTAKFDNNNNILHYIGFVNDITELKKYREHLEDLVKTRTNELQLKNKELDNALKVFVGRELTIKQLQNRIKELEVK
ncbi:MAG: PAS domain S-box protein [Saprospiraceae bacterium]|nr:PAS domain S-box protein [Saprospiraceae bacterium]